MRGLVSVRKLQSVLQIAETRGLDRSALVTALNVSASDLADLEGWVPQRVWHDLWIEVVARTGNPGIGVDAARQIGRGYFGVIDYVVRSCNTMQEAIAAAARLFPLANTQATIRFRRETGLLWVERHLLGDEDRALPQQAAEFSLVSMVRTFRLAAAEPWPVAKVTFRHSRPDYSARHEAFFNAPVEFGASADAIAVPESVLETPMKAPDPTLRGLIESHAASLIKELPVQRDLADQVKRALSTELAGGSPQADHVASKLGFSRRTLTRELKSLGTSFSTLLRETRLRMAQQYLGDERISVGEIAFLLGYSDVSSFHRAFTSWTGETPIAVRRGT